jgi:acyl dehydratase
MTSLAELQKGHEFPPATFELTDAWADAYIAAVQDETVARVGADFVPPMAVAALSVRALLQHASLPPGSLHAGQELVFSSPVRRGDTLTATARIASRGERQGAVLMSIELDVDRGAEDIMTGRATIAFPAEGGTL